MAKIMVPALLGVAAAGAIGTLAHTTEAKVPIPYSVFNENDGAIDGRKIILEQTATCLNEIESQQAGSEVIAAACGKIAGAAVIETSSFDDAVIDGSYINWSTDAGVDEEEGSYTISGSVRVNSASSQQLAEAVRSYENKVGSELTRREVENTLAVSSIIGSMVFAISTGAAAYAGKD